MKGLTPPGKTLEGLRTAKSLAVGKTNWGGLTCLVRQRKLRGAAWMTEGDRMLELRAGGEKGRWKKRAGDGKKEDAWSFAPEKNLGSNQKRKTEGQKRVQKEKW